MRVCADWRDRTTFVGSGSTVLSNINCHPVPEGRPDQVACSPVDVTVKASNVSIAVPVSTDSPDEDPYDRPRDPVTSRPSSKPQILHNTAGCSKASQSPSWTVTGFYHSDLGVRFSLTNNVLNYTTRCNLQDLTLGFGVRVDQNTGLSQNIWWNCSRYDNTHATYPYDGIYTEVLYGGLSNLLGINQTWYCDDEDASNP